MLGFQNPRTIAVSRFAYLILRVSFSTTANASRFWFLEYLAHRLLWHHGGEPQASDIILRIMLWNGIRRRLSASVRAISFVMPGYLETLGIPLLAGRDFSLRDVGRPRIAIVSTAVARHFFPGVNPIGMRITIVCEQPAAFPVRDQHGPPGDRGCPEDGARNEGQDAVRAGRCVHHSRVSHRYPVRILRNPGSGACWGRTLRTAGLERGAPNQRDRYPHGVRRDNRRRKPPRFGRCDWNAGRRIPGWSVHGVVGHAPGCEPAPGLETGEQRHWPWPGAPLRPSRCWPRICRRGAQRPWTRWSRCAMSSRCRRLGLRYRALTARPDAPSPLPPGVEEAAAQGPAPAS